MKDFFKTMFASMLGFILAGFILLILTIAIIAGIASSAGKKDVEVSDSSVIHIQLKGPIKERGSDNPLEDLTITGFSNKHSVGLNQLLTILKKGKDDAKIKGVFIEVEDANSGFATLDEVRNAIIDFKKSGKFVYSYADNFSQKGYYIASAADKVFLHPQGGLDFKGLSAEIVFLKKALEKLDIEPQIIRHGQFKSAIEPLILDKMSEANREQTAKYLGTIWKHIRIKISSSRNISVDELGAIAQELRIRKAEDALSNKLVDNLSYRDEVMSEIKKKLNLKEEEKIKLISVKNYYDAVHQDKAEGGSRIAVIYAGGEIKDGEAESDEIGSADLSKTIREARTNKNIKAIVLRVNSPGGSALASDVIWREMVLAKKEKPVVVSIGDVAASGGYYISCAADRIFASPVSITGSIGVFGVLFNGQRFLEQKLGITVDTVKTNTHADLGSVYRPLTSEERMVVQQSVEDVYTTFITRVGKGRNMRISQVDSVGQGRVWAGYDAGKIQLVDEFGGLNEAVAYAARLAKINESDMRVQELPSEKPLFEKFISELSGEEEARILEERLGPAYKYYLQAKHLIQVKGVQARVPYEIEIN